MSDPAHIELKLQNVGQLFDAAEASPFRTKALTPDAEEYLEKCAAAMPAGVTPRLTMWVQTGDTAPAAARRVEQALQAHFRSRAEQNRRHLRSLKKTGRRTTLIGLIFLATCLSLAATMFPEGRTGPLGTVLRESLTIAGWVAMWRPLEICLYDWWPIWQRGRLLLRLARLSVEISPANAGTPAENP